MAGVPKSIAKSVTTAGTRVTLVAATTETAEVVIRANPLNTGNIFLGGADVSSTVGYILKPGESFSFSQLRDLTAGATRENYMIDLLSIYLDSEVNGEGVRALYTVRS